MENQDYITISRSKKKEAISKLNDLYSFTNINTNSHEWKQHYRKNHSVSKLFFFPRNLFCHVDHPHQFKKEEVLSFANIPRSDHRISNLFPAFLDLSSFQLQLYPHHAHQLHPSFVFIQRAYLCSLFCFLCFMGFTAYCMEHTWHYIWFDTKRCSIIRYPSENHSFCDICLYLFVFFYYHLPLQNFYKIQ